MEQLRVKPTKAVHILGLSLIDVRREQQSLNVCMKVED